MERFIYYGKSVFKGANPTDNVLVNPAFIKYDVNTGATLLTPGQQYVAFYTTTTAGGSNTDCRWAYLGTNADAGMDAYAGGNFVFNNASQFSELPSGWRDPTWYDGTAADDAAFRLTFAGVPEPPTLLLTVLGSIGLLGHRLRA